MATAFLGLANFAPRHIPALIAATTQSLGGLVPILGSPSSAMKEFGFSQQTYESPLAWPVMKTCSARTTVLGVMMWIFYARGQYDVLDVFLAVTGGWCAVVDSYVVWNEGKKGWAAFRLVSSAALSVCGLVGLTQGV